MENTIRSDMFGLSSTQHLCKNAVLHPGNDVVMMWWLCHHISNEVLGSTPQTWLNGLALSQVSRLTLSGTPKILLYCTEYNWPSTLAPTNEESSWAQWGKNLQEKNYLSIESSEVNVWLVWILPIKHKSLKRVETCQKKHFNFWLFCYVNSFFQN